MEPDLFDKHIPELINEQETEIQQATKVKQDPVRVTINVPLGGPLAGPAVAAPPADPPAPPRVVAPAVRPRTAPVHLPVFDSSSSDEPIPNLFDENSSSDENLADLNLDAEQIARVPVNPLIADEIRQQEPEVRVPLVSSSSDDEMFLPSQQPQPSIVPFDIESPPETHEEQFALTDRKIRARPYNPKRKPEKSSFKSTDYQQRKNVRGFKRDREIMLHKEDRTNPYLTNRVRRSGSPRPKNARARLEPEEKREAIKASAQAAQQSTTPSRETKLDQVRASIAKYSGKKPRSSANKPVTRSQTKNSSPGSSNQNLNHFSQEINATYLSSPTDILYSPHSFAHCISADLAMAKGLARQVKSWYPAAPSAIRLRYPPDIGSVLIYFDPISERYIFSLVTKFRYYHKPTYESVLASLYELREIVIDAEITHLSLPKLASGYDKLDFNIIFELICQVFDPLPITIYIH